MTSWPKVRPELTQRQTEVMEDWYSVFLGDTLPGKFGWVDRFNHKYAARTEFPGARTLEIGPGNGSHLEYETLSQQEEYVAVELRPSLGAEMSARYPTLSLTIGDVQTGLDFPDNSFDRVLAIHVLEHLDNLPAALREVHRVLRPGGSFSVLIPCEDGRLYSLGRWLTVRRTFEKRYGLPYEWMIKYEHINTAREILDEIGSLFAVSHREFFPFRVPLVDASLIIGLTLSPVGKSASQ